MSKKTWPFTIVADENQNAAYLWERSEIYDTPEE